MKHFNFYATVIICMMGYTIFPQNKQPSEATQKLLDSLSTSPQGTLESDLYYKLILEHYPNTDEALMSRSVAYNKRGDPATAFLFLNNATTLNPLSHLGYRGFVKLYMMHDFSGALVDFLKLDSLTNYAKPGAWGEDLDKVIGLCYLKLNNFEQASIYLTSCIEHITKKNGVKWNSPRTLLYMGITLIKQKDYASAITMFDNLIQLNPNYSEAYYFKALCYYEEKNYVKSYTEIQKCRDTFNKHGVETNPYFEMPYQIYSSMILDLLKLVQ